MALRPDHGEISYRGSGRLLGRKAVALPGDIQDEIFCTALVNSAVAQLGGLDILVNNAARQTPQDSIFDITTEQLDATLKTNFYAMFWITKTALKYLIASFTKGLAKQFANQGICVNAVAPGPMGRPGQPAELAALYVLLATNEAAYTTGQIFGAVGGSGVP